MNKIQRTLISSLLLLAIAPFLYAQSADPDRNMGNQSVRDLGQQDNLEGAVIAAQQAIELAQASVGPDHPYVAICLSNLALLYRNHGDYAKAEPLYKRSLAIWEKTLGPDHPYVANCLNNLSELYHAMGKDKEAAAVEKRIALIRGLKR